MAAAHLLLYYVLAFLLEEDLFRALREGGLSLVWRRSRLLSVEFCVLYLPVLGYVFAVFLPEAGAELWEACQGQPSCSWHLRRSGWAWARAEPRWHLVDLADIQWREFRGSLPLLLAAAAALAVLVRLLLWALERQPGLAAGARRSSVPGALVRLLPGLGFVAYVHGFGIAFPAALVAAFYLVARLTAGTRAAVPAAWGLALLAIAAKEPQWPLRRRLTFGALAGPRWAFLDGQAYQGEYDWAQSVNLIVLRLLSFALDGHAAATREKQAPGGLWPALPARYSLAHGLSHAFYAPVVLAGPTIGFDDYLEQCASPRPTLSQLGSYLVQLACACAALEAFTHLYPCFALARSGAIGEFSPRLGVTAVFLTLNLMWLKFLVLWRVARAWALADGIDVPENMRRALCNHYSLVSFWRCWHSSFNRWLVRYVYVPVGGRNNKIIAAAVTFAFVAFWHDAEVKLLAWGGLNALFLACETLVAAAWHRRAGGLAAARPWLHRQIGALGGTAYIMVLMAVNMIGYVVGVSGISGLLATAAGAGAETAWTFLAAYVVLFSGVQVMLEIRQLDGTHRPDKGPAAEAEQKAQ